MRTALGVLSLVLIASLPARAEPPPEAAPKRTPTEAVRLGLGWLEKHQHESGSWGGTHSTAVTGLACLAILASEPQPFAGQHGAPLCRAVTFLLKQAKDGVFPQQGHTWIHGQGFATLALAEAYGKAMFAEKRPDLDEKALRDTVTKGVAAIARHQSTSGGWWYTPGQPHQHEGSTTVCAVQALVAAANYAIPIDEQVLAKGFEYLKLCQNEDGGFDYKLGDAHSMKEGTAGGVATLALMRRFDYRVMTDGVEFLKGIGPGAISRERFPYYGHFYAGMGLTLFGEEMGAEKDAATYVEAAHADVLAWQGDDGAWPLKGWMTGHPSDLAYATAFAALLLQVPEKRLSIFNRKPPTLKWKVTIEQGSSEAGS